MKPLSQKRHYKSEKKPADPTYKDQLAFRAGNGGRTRDPQLGKLMLYQLSYFRVISCKNSK